MANRSRVSRRGVAAALVVVALGLAGCRGENRPNVEVIGGADTASVSASELGPEEAAAAATAEAASPSGIQATATSTASPVPTARPLATPPAQ